MIDVQVLRGAAVRNSDGTSGRIVGVSLPWVTLGWQEVGTILPREEAVLRSDKDRLGQVEILTLDRGWVPLLSVVGTAEPTGPRGLGLAEELEKLLAEPLEEKADRRPFKTAKSIGPGPRGGWRHGKKHVTKHYRRDYWKCKCSQYTCKCKGNEGEKKTVNIDPSYRSDYNAQYKQWHRASLHKAAPGHFIGRTKKEIARKAKTRAKLARLAKKRRKYK